jgi:hypothetical protein
MRGAFQFGFTGACSTIADSRQGASLINLRGERRWSGLAHDTWRSVIGCLDFYPINTLNSIISLQINVLFFY